tara:strand:+ start:168 stop:914 length:747 start_codon:yes stop_codon:yes gene_type:complete
MKIHKTSIIEDGAKLGSNVSIGPYSHIGKNVILGDNVVIQGYCEIGVHSFGDNKKLLQIGDNSLIRSKSIFYTGSTFGPKLITGHNVTVRENVIAGKNLQLGTLTDIQGDCKIGDYVRCHSNVHIGKTSKIGNFVWIYPYVVLTNDPTPPSTQLINVVLEDFVVIAVMSTILPGVILREGTLVGAHSNVRNDTNPNTLVSGNPAMEKCLASKIKLKDGSKKNAYPWIRHFHKSYPPEIIKEWKRKFKN